MGLGTALAIQAGSTRGNRDEEDDTGEDDGPEGGSSSPRPPTARPSTTGVNKRRSELPTLQLLNQTIATGALPQEQEQVLTEVLETFPSARPDTITIDTLPGRTEGMAYETAEGRQGISLDHDHRTDQAGYITDRDSPQTPNHALLHELGHIMEFNNFPRNEDLEILSKGLGVPAAKTEPEADLWANALARQVGAERMALQDSMPNAEGEGKVATRPQEDYLTEQLKTRASKNQ